MNRILVVAAVAFAIFSAAAVSGGTSDEQSTTTVAKGTILDYHQPQV